MLSGWIHFIVRYYLFEAFPGKVWNFSPTYSQFTSPGSDGPGVPYSYTSQLLSPDSFTPKCEIVNGKSCRYGVLLAYRFLHAKSSESVKLFSSRSECSQQLRKEFSWIRCRRPSRASIHQAFLWCCCLGPPSSISTYIDATMPAIPFPISNGQQYLWLKQGD